MHSLETISHYGYIACYVALALGLFGLPVPDEIVLTFIGTLTATSSFSYTSVLFITFGGVLTGALSTYGIGRWIGAPFLQRFGHWIGLNEQRLATIDKWSKSYGSKMAFIGFLIPGMRSAERLYPPFYTLRSDITSLVRCNEKSHSNDSHSNGLFCHKS